MEKVFIDGMICKDAKPDFVLCKVSIKTDEFGAFMAANSNDEGWLNIDIKRSKGGKIYAELNTWKKEPQAEAPAGEDFPF